MGFIDKLTDVLIKRRLKKKLITINPDTSHSEQEFRRVFNTLREKRIMVKKEKDGIYIRMAGDRNKGQAFSLEWGKVISYER